MTFAVLNKKLQIWVFNLKLQSIFSLDKADERTQRSELSVRDCSVKQNLTQSSRKKTKQFFI